MARMSNEKKSTRARRDIVSRIRRLNRRLAEAYGTPSQRRRHRGLDQLIATVLSQNTNDNNSIEGFRRLKRRFRSWKRAAEAPACEIAEAIRVSGLANVKSVRIKEILQRVKADHGRYTLEPVGRMPLQEARDYLRSFKGVGEKTVACVLLFSFDMPVFPVDTHILRVSKRLGLIPQKATADQAHEILQALVPADLVYAFHLLLIRHGRNVCHARKPECGRCVIAADCHSCDTSPD